jgi:shikimate kinase
VDTDSFIERKEGRSISDIFADDGEDYFRSLETEVLKELMQVQKPQVLSLGGGTPLRQCNREIMKEGYTIFLKITADEAYRRLKDDSERPLLKVQDPKARIEELLLERNPLYEAAADYVLYEKNKSLDDILDLHQRFEAIHPFQDGNGRVGRLIMFKECLANGIVPFIITDELKLYYYRGLQQWPQVKEYLRDTCLTAQDNYKALLDYFRIEYI